MKKLLALTLVVLSFRSNAGDYSHYLPEKYVVVANKDESSLTVLSSPEGKMLKKITAKDTGFKFEPIYAATLPRFKMIAVSDRKNSQLLFFDNQDLRYLGSVPSSQGMFHMWPTPEQKEIFAVADIDRVVDAIEINRFGDQIVYKKRLIDIGSSFDSGKPHDVVVDKKNIFVTMIGVEENGEKVDYVVKYDRDTLKFKGKLKFTFDIHLGIPKQSPYLLIPEQTAGRLNYVDKEKFKVVTTVEGLQGAHGIFWNADASKVYLANFTSQGPMSVYEVRQSSGSNQFSAKKVVARDLMDAKAHNITVDFVNQTMFVTHTGPNVDGKLNTNVSVFSIQGDLKLKNVVESGITPLGILLGLKINYRLVFSLKILSKNSKTPSEPASIIFSDSQNLVRS